MTLTDIGGAWIVVAHRVRISNDLDGWDWLLDARGVAEIKSNCLEFALAQRRNSSGRFDLLAKRRTR